ncbi:MAG: GerMN domain-containing protein [Actinomycetota bacterium]|nr:GerMN domain-containing protein [Actinomycetota bacterium]
MNIKKFEKTSFWCLKPRNSFKVLTLLFALLLSLTFISSCSMLSSSSTTKVDVESSTESSAQESVEDTETTDPESTENNENTTSSIENENTDEPDTSSTTNETETSTTKEGLTIRVYYAGAEAIYLVGEERMIKGSHKYFEAFIELMKPPITPGLIKLIPDTAKVNKITEEDANIDIDLSQSFIDDRFQSHSVDILLIYSIVNTMTEFPEINTVTFHFDGKKADTFGQMDLSGPFYRDASLIKKND